jgi:hypothetical protein
VDDDVALRPTTVTVEMTTTTARRSTMASRTYRNAVDPARTAPPATGEHERPRTRIEKVRRALDILATAGGVFLSEPKPAKRH